MSEETNVNSALVVVVWVVVILVVTPMIINGGLILIGTIWNALQPKTYEAKITYNDGSVETRKGTKKEMNEWLKSKQGL